MTPTDARLREIAERNHIRNWLLDEGRKLKDRATRTTVEQLRWEVLEHSCDGIFRFETLVDLILEGSRALLKRLEVPHAR